MNKPGTHTDQRCAECQKAEPIIRPFVMKIWHCCECHSVLCTHTAVDPTTYGNAFCAYCKAQRDKRTR